jgi:hypothetical protein
MLGEAFSMQVFCFQMRTLWKAVSLPGQREMVQSGGSMRAL